MLKLHATSTWIWFQEIMYACWRNWSYETDVKVKHKFSVTVGLDGKILYQLNWEWKWRDKLESLKHNENFMGNMNNKSSTISKWCYIKRTRHRLAWAFQSLQDSPFSCRSWSNLLNLFKFYIQRYVLLNSVCIVPESISLSFIYIICHNRLLIHINIIVVVTMNVYFYSLMLAFPSFSASWKGILNICFFA